MSRLIAARLQGKTGAGQPVRQVSAQRRRRGRCMPTPMEKMRLMAAVRLASVVSLETAGRKVTVQVHIERPARKARAICAGSHTHKTRAMFSSGATMKQNSRTGRGPNLRPSAPDGQCADEQAQSERAVDQADGALVEVESSR